MTLLAGADAGTFSTIGSEYHEAQRVFNGTTI